VRGAHRHHALPPSHSGSTPPSHHQQQQQHHPPKSQRSVIPGSHNSSRLTAVPHHHIVSTNRLGAPTRPCALALARAARSGVAILPPPPSLVPLISPLKPFARHFPQCQR
jgi:hypothetical protein